MISTTRNRTGLLALATCLLAVGCNLTDTVYAPGYKEKDFKKIKVGDSLDRVNELVVEPLLILPQDSYDLWEYDDKPDHLIIDLKHRDSEVKYEKEVFYWDKDGELTLEDKIPEYFSVGRLPDGYQRPSTITEYGGIELWLYTNQRTVYDSFQSRRLLIDRNLNQVIEVHSYLHVD